MAITPLSLKKYPLYVKIGLLIIILVFSFYKVWSFYGTDVYRPAWNTCVDYLHQGTLWSGQPYCEGHPFVIYLLWFFDSIVGRSYLSFAMLVFFFLLSALFYYLFLKTVRKEFPKEDFFWPTLFFSLFVVINTSHTIESLLNGFFFFIGMCFLLYSSSRFKYLLGGSFFFLSALSKITVFVPIFFVFLWYFFNVKKMNNFSFPDMSSFKSFLFISFQIALPPVFGFLIFQLFYKHFWLYLFGVYLNQPLNVISLGDTFYRFFVVELVQGNLLHLVLLLASFVGIYIFVKHRSFYGFLAGPCLLFILFFMYKQYGYVSLFRYYSPLFPFVIFSFFRLKEMWSSDQFKKPFYYLILFAFLVYPGLYYTPFYMKNPDTSYIDPLHIDHLSSAWQDKDAFVKMLHYGYSVVPEVGGRILMQGQSPAFKQYFSSFGSNIPVDKVDLVDIKYALGDPDWSAFSLYQKYLSGELIYHNKSLFTTPLTPYELSVVEKIESDIYDLIILAPPDWVVLNTIILNVSSSHLSCDFYIPTNVWLNQEGSHLAHFFFRNREDCISSLSSVRAYYATHFKEICRIDKFSANQISAVLNKRRFIFPYYCEQGGDSLSYYKSEVAIKQYEMGVFFLLSSFVLLMSLLYNFFWLRVSFLQHYYLFYIVVFLFFFLGLLYLFVLPSPPPFGDPIVSTFALIPKLL